MGKTNKGRAAQYVVALPKVRIDLGDHHEELIRGDSCESVPEDTLDTMIRLGQAVPSEELEPDEAMEEPEVATDWQQTMVSDMGLPERVVHAVEVAGLETVRDVLQFGAEHGDLTDLQGIGEASDRQIKEAIQKLAAAAGA